MSVSPDNTVDDGAIAHVNGSEAWRLGFTNGQPVSFGTFSAGASGPAQDIVLLTNNVPLAYGDNLLAVEVHQANDTSADVVFAARIVALHRSLAIGRASANLTVSWTPVSAQLEESPDLIHWSNTSRANGLPAPPSAAQMFYRVR